MPTWKDDAPNHKINGINRFFFPEWKSWIRYYPGHVVARTTESILAVDSEIKVNIPGFSYDIVEEIEGDVEDTIPAAVEGGESFTWDSETKTWLNVPSTFSGAFTVNEAFINLTPTVDSPVVYPVQMVLPIAADLRYVFYFSTNTVKIDASDVTAVEVVDSGPATFAFNDGGYFNIHGDNTDAWFFIHEGFVVETSFPGVDYGRYCQVGAETTGNYATTTIWDQAVNANVILDCQTYSIASSMPAQRLNGRINAERYVQEDQIWYNRSTDTFTGFYEFRRIRPRFAFTWPGTSHPSGRDISYFVNDGEVIGTTEDPDNRFAYSAPAYGDSGTLDIYMHNDRDTIVETVTVGDIITIDGSAFLETEISTPSREYNQVKSALVPGPKNITWLYQNGSLLESWETASSYAFTTRLRSPFPQVEVRTESNGVEIDTENVFVFQAQSDDSDFLGGSSVTTITTTISEPDKNLIIAPNDKTFSIWTCIADNVYGVDPNDSEAARGKWQVTHDFQFDTIANELEALIYYYQDQTSLATDVDWEQIVNSMKDSDSDATATYNTFLEALERIEYDVTGFHTTDETLRSEFDRIVAIEYHDSDALEVIIDNQQDSEEGERPLLVGFVDKVKAEETERDSDQASVSIDSLITKYDEDSEIISLIVNHPDQIFTDSEMGILSLIENHSRLFDDIDSDNLRLLDTEILFPSKAAGTLPYDSEDLLDIDSDWRAKADFSFTNIPAFSFDGFFPTHEISYRNGTAKSYDMNFSQSLLLSTEVTALVMDSGFHSFYGSVTIKCINSTEMSFRRFVCLYDHPTQDRKLVELEAADVVNAGQSGPLIVNLSTKIISNNIYVIINLENQYRPTPFHLHITGYFL